MIPRSIKREHILKAIEAIRKNGVPDGRGSKKFLTEFDGYYYPPKYIISLANKYANGEELDSSKFSGGTESNDFLRALGFKIVEKKLLMKVVQPTLKKYRETSSSLTHHGERCPKCKKTVRELLERVYGKVEQNYKFEVGTHVEDFSKVSCNSRLKEIYEALQDYRGLRNFVKAKILPNCDFFIPDLGFLVEFDESQHFTLPRRIALKMYPRELELGFGLEKWVVLCEKINARDNDPPYRDEQRAWYDTLRDFLPEIKGLKPTIRLFAGDFAWCSLNPNNTTDIQIFNRFLRKPSENWGIEVRDEPDPFLSRIIIAGKWNGDPNKAKAVLKDVCAKWPKGKKATFLITCGGFVQFDWPKSISRSDIGNNKNPNEKTVNALVAEAQKCARFILDEGLSSELREFTDYITLGVDSSKEKISTTKNYIGQLHVELVFLVDLRSNNFYWTGKSYPTSKQEESLVRISDLETHFLDLDDVGKTMILGCHDLTVFNPMSRLNPNRALWRREVNNEFRELARREKPICVLHHPHTTIKERTWLNAWNGLSKTLPSVKSCAGAGRYHEPDRDPSEWGSLDNVLTSTKRGNSIDFVVWID